MRPRTLSIIFPLMLTLCALHAPQWAIGQATMGVITGVVTDVQGAVLKGAEIHVQPSDRVVTSGEEGHFTVLDLAPGVYTVTVSYVGFASYATSVTVVAGQIARLAPELKVASNREDVIVTATRPHGEAEAINETRAADNILQILPSEVITSLPNANIADALGRMPSVTIERDEGEGKYVQIRGTEPRLSNTMVDGVTIPSPESGVRQIKLDTIASDLVSSVEVNKTLQANMDADGIGGSVNLVTKTAEETPTVDLFGVGGYTPILSGVGVDQFGGTIGKRFGPDKRLGVLLGGTYDYNGRGINDIEPVPTPGDAVPHYSSADLRDYKYNRTRWGAAGSTDYRLGPGSTIALRGLFSTFRNWGHKWVFTLNDGSNPVYSQDWRRPNMAIGSLNLEGRHVFGSSWLTWNAAVSRSRSLSGSGGANYQWMGDPNIDCTNDQSVAASVNRPGWSAGCFGTGADNATDRSNYGLIEWDPPTFGQSVQLNLQAAGSYAHIYHLGTHFSTIEFGAKVRNAHKFDDTYNEAYVVPTDASGNPIPIPDVAHPEWNSDLSDPDYYDNTYKHNGVSYGTVTDWGKVKGWVLTNPGDFQINGGPGVNSNNYDLVERIPAGYVMNTLDFTGNIRLVAGVRIEATHLDTTSFDETANTLSFKAGGDYLNVLPSASLRFALDKNSDVRLVYGRGLARPDPQDVSAAVGQPDKTQTPPTISVGNPNLKAETANNYDVLYERYLNPVGLIQAGYFFKDLGDPITTVQTKPTTGPFAGYLVTQPGNAGSAHVQGVEFGFQQRLSWMPGALGGFGISANYSYTTSVAHDIPGRSDSPALLRQAPNTWNISPTYDTNRFSMRVGMTFDDAMIYAYQWTDGADSVGIKGPSGDNYLYAHYQFDTQASYRLWKGFSVYGYGLNLNNEVFGFYNGSPQYVVQREYYHPTYAGGLRYTFSREH
jgi:TonB-dependent receptor